MISIDMTARAYAKQSGDDDDDEINDYVEEIKLTASNFTLVATTSTSISSFFQI